MGPDLGGTDAPTIIWIGATRMDHEGDWGDGQEVIALSETTEEYEVDILDPQDITGETGCAPSPRAGSTF